VTDFLAHLGTTKRAKATARMYRQKCGHLTRVFGADRKLADVTAVSVDQFILRRLEEGAARTTVGKELTALRQTLKLAKRHGAYPFDMAAVMPHDFKIEAVARRRALTWEEFSALVPAVAEHHKKHAGMVVFFVATGARKSEAESARGEDIDWERWTIRIRGTKTETADDTIPIAEPFRALFTQWVPRRKGELWGEWANMVRDLGAACRRAKIDRVTANDLRRSMATLLRRSGVSVDVLARLLRHADSRMVERVYGRIGAEATGRVLAAQLAAGPIEHRQQQHSGWCSVLPEATKSACVEGQSRTGDTRIFSPNREVVWCSPIGDFSAVLVPTGSSESAGSAGSSARNSTVGALGRASLAWFRRAS
jgi:integrase